jgi:molybdopterin synthase catalytic subunit
MRESPVKSATPFLTDQSIDPASLLASVSGADRGGVVSFLGLVRNHNAGRAVDRLEYSAYSAMAETECAAIVREAEQNWPVRLALRHRVGQLRIGEVAVAVVAAAAHRGEAFEACRYAIEQLKRRVPIWKKEHYADGSVEWVDQCGSALSDMEVG